MFEDFEKLVKTRQSCREFSDRAVEKEKLDKIVELARFAPSACNSQPWKIYCISSTEAVSAVRECLQFQEHNKFLDGAKAFVAVADMQAVLKPNVESKFDRNRFVEYDVGEVIAYITLGAKAIGLETCIIGWMNESKLSSVLGLSDNETCRVVVAVGYSDIPVREKVRKDVQTVVKYI